MIWSICSVSHLRGILRNLVKLCGMVEMWSIRWHSSLDMNFEPWVSLSLCYATIWWKKSAQKGEKILRSPVVWKIKMLLGNNFHLWMTRTDEFPSLPVHPKEMAFDCQLVVRPLHTSMYSFYCSWTAVLHKVLWTTLRKTLHVLSFKFSFPFPCVPKDTNGCSVTEGLYFLLSTMGLCITVSNFSPDCAISLGDV